MLDHVGIVVRDFAASRRFYLAALGALGLEVVGEGDDWAMLGASGRPELWVGGGPGRSAAAPVHLAFQVAQRWPVDEFHAAGLGAGGRNNGAPGLRLHYHPDYYAAFLLDPDGHNVEAVCHRPA